MDTDEKTALQIRTLSEVIAQNDSWIAKSAAILGGALLAFWALAEHTDRMAGFFSGLLVLASASFMIGYVVIVWRTLVENGELRSRRREALNLMGNSRHSPMSIESVNSQFSLALLGRETSLGGLASRATRRDAPVRVGSADAETEPTMAGAVGATAGPSHDPNPR